MVRVARVEPGSIADELEITPGAELHTVNGRRISDFLDWEFLSADEEIVVEGVDAAGAETVWEIAREEMRPLGIELEPPRIRRCANECEFCFIEGLPPGLRKSLYVRDDDYRLSFAYGNFATLSNLRDTDYERIFEYRLSPLYVSVHATEEGARQRLLNNSRVPNIIAQLARLATGGISFHCQIVVVPGINDGAVLERSLADLWDLGGAALSTAVVPVGLTQFSHLYSGRTMSREDAGLLLEQIEPWSARAVRERGSAWVFGSDELYLLAGRALPPAAHYGEYPQIENGVGAVTWLRERVSENLRTLRDHSRRTIGIITGLSMAPIMPGILEQLSGATGAAFEMVSLENSLFGRTTTVAGLLPGKDIATAVAGMADLDLVLIPAESINDSGVFLDDVRFRDVAASSPVRVVPSYDFIDVLGAETLVDSGA
jgi:putative radical SAM enzyme (TIGR03279 family)